MTSPTRAGALAMAVAAGAAAAVAAPTAGPIHRLALVVGANHGADRVTLRYAVADAERFARVVTQMGGVPPADAAVLREPTRRALLDALAGVKSRVQKARAEAARVEVLFYFSGHADDQGLLLGRERLAYRDLREAVGGLGADVGITILDACASGAITRLKGGSTHPAFLTDASREVQGYAFLTSSSENEAAQESERLQGSFFTHALLTGLRGAADVSGDGKVTLGEAYQFAFHETLALTTPTEGGAQHPAYDIKMAGTGDVVLTDVRETGSSLILGPDYDGRFFVLNDRRQLVAELFKPHGRTVELGLEPGGYEVYYEQEQKLLATSLKLGHGQRLELDRQGLRAARRLPTRRRGPGPADAAAADPFDKRTRLQVTWAVSDRGVTTSQGLGSSSYASTSTGVGTSSATTVLHWIRPDLGLELSFSNLDVGNSVTPEETRSVAIRGVLVGARYYPHLREQMRPYLGARLGLFDEYGTITRRDGATRVTGGGRLGGTLGGGLDLLLGRHLVVMMDAGFRMIRGRSSKLDVLIGVGWTFGGPRR